MARLLHVFESVRLRLLLLSLLPLGLILPAFMGLVVYWGNAAYDQLLVYKVNAELVIAHEYLDKVMRENQLRAERIAQSDRMAGAMRQGAVSRSFLDELAKRDGFDFLHLLDPSGRVRASSSDLAAGTSQAHWPVINGAMTGRSGAVLDVFGPEELDALSEGMRARAVVKVIPTANAARDDKREEARGLMIHVAAPVLHPDGRLAAIVEGGLLLNLNLAFVDRINEIVYTERALPLGSRGTVTLFLDDVRIATNVRLFAGGPEEAGAESGARALGTRVSLAVRDKVLGEGKTWLDRAFVVNDWYMSGYEPLMDSHGRRVGMLYVGYLEAPFARVKRNVLASIAVLFLVISLAASAFSLAWARQIFRPLERMDATMDALEAGRQEARVGPLEARDEIGRLAEHFDRLLDNLERRSRELTELNAELDRKVIERTAALSQANAELKQAQQHLVRSEKLAAIGQLTAGTAHEINNPIAVMQGNLDLIRSELGEASAPLENELRLLDEQINRIRVIVTKLLQFARPGEFAGYVESVDVNAVVQDCLLLTRHELRKGSVEVRLELAATMPVRLNRNELQQVLINLIVNALQAMPEGGALILATEDWREGMQPRGVRIRVADTGTGIAPDQLSRVFDPFFTTKKTQGTGLGLSVSLSLIERYGGTIDVESEPGRGSVFSVWLLAEPRFGQEDRGRLLPTSA